MTKIIIYSLYFILILLSSLKELGYFESLPIFDYDIYLKSFITYIAFDNILLQTSLVKREKKNPIKENYSLIKNNLSLNSDNMKLSYQSYFTIEKEIVKLIDRVLKRINPENEVSRIFIVFDEDDISNIDLIIVEENEITMLKEEYPNRITINTFFKHKKYSDMINNPNYFNNRIGVSIKNDDLLHQIINFHNDILFNFDLYDNMVHNITIRIMRNLNEYDFIVTPKFALLGVTNEYAVTKLYFDEFYYYENKKNFI